MERDEIVSRLFDLAFIRRTPLPEVYELAEVVLSLIEQGLDEGTDNQDRSKDD